MLVLIVIILVLFLNVNLTRSLYNQVFILLTSNDW